MSTIIPNRTKRVLAEGGTAVGFGIHHLRGAAAPLIAEAAGYDWIFIDMEHGAMSVEQASQIALAALPIGITPIVRVCADALHEGCRMLDNGAMGIVIPHVDAAQQARRVAETYRFPPLGHRSAGAPPAAYGFRPPALAEAMAGQNDETLIVCMIETPEAVADAAAIAAVPGVDVLFFGTNDLTAAMGIPGQLGHPDVEAAYRTVGQACAAHGKVMGMGGITDEDLARCYMALGARFVLAGTDHSLLLPAATARATFLRGLSGG